MPYVLFAVVCLIWSSSFVLMKKAQDVFGPVSVGAARCVGGAAAIGLLVWFWRSLDRQRRLERRHLGAIAVSAGVGIVIPWVLQPYLIGRYQDSAFFGMMVSLVPLLTMIVQVPMLKVYPTVRQAVGVLGGLVCIGLLFEAGRVRGVPPEAVAVAVVVPTTYALSNTWIKRTLSDAPSNQMSAVMLCMAGLVLVPMSVATEGIAEADASTWSVAIASLLVLSVLGSGLAMAMFYRLIATHGPLFAGMVTYVVPCGAVLLGFADGEPLHTQQVIALVGILAMVALVQWPRKQTAGEPG